MNADDPELSTGYPQVINKNVNFQEKISEKVKLDPPTPKVTEPKHETNMVPITAIGGNGLHKSPYTGVNWCPNSGKWHAVLRVGNKKISMGRHMTDRAAGLAFDLYARALIKRLERGLNFPAESDALGVASTDQLTAGIEEGKNPEDAEFFGPSVNLNKDELRRQAMEEDGDSDGQG